MYDRYRRWALSDTKAPIPPSRRSVEDQVLGDLAAATDEEEKLEILDSYSAYARRAYREDVACVLAQRAGQVLATILRNYLLPELPSVTPVCRPRAGQKSKAE